MLLMEDSDYYSLYNEMDRKQLLFQIFTQLVVGGGMAQFEDNISPYLDVAKDIYKDLIRPGKGEKKVWRIKNSDIFPSDSERHLCIVSVDLEKREVTVFYSAFITFW